MNRPARSALLAAEIGEVQQQPEVERWMREGDPYASRLRVSHRLRDVVVFVPVEERPQFNAFADLALVLQRSRATV